MENNQQPLPSEQKTDQLNSVSPTTSYHPSKTFIVLMLMLLILTVGVGGYFLGANKSQVVQNQTQPVPQAPQPSPTPVDETADWKTYRNEEYRFGFKYPSTWKLEERSSSSLKIAESLESLRDPYIYTPINWYRSYQDVEENTGFVYDAKSKQWGYLAFDPHERASKPEDFTELEKIFTTLDGTPVYCLSHEGGANYLIHLPNNIFILMYTLGCIVSPSELYGELYGILVSFDTIP